MKSSESMTDGIILEEDEDEILDEYTGREMKRYKKPDKKRYSEENDYQSARKNSKKPSTMGAKKKNNKKKPLIVVIIAIVAIILSVIITLFVRESSMNQKYQKYLKEGKAYYKQEDYPSARTRFIEAAQNASSDEQKLEVYSLLYNIDVLIAADYKEKIDFLEILIDLDDSEVQYYKDLIVLYQNHDMDSQIDALITSAPSAVKTELEGYIGTIPQASVEEGTYNSPITVELKADENVTIYYTRDGSDVTQSDAKIEYATPIKFKKEGTYTIRAYSVDSHGVSSKEAVYSYNISFVHVDEPKVSLASGTYSQSQKVEVTAAKGCTIYYTNDGSVPTKSSKKYKKAITIEKGNNIYSFIAYNKDGAPSDVVRRIYDFSPNYSCSYDTAIANLRGYYAGLDEYNEYSDGSAATFTFNEIAEIEKKDYYIITYAKEDGSDSQKFAVSCDSGQCHKVSGGSENYKLSDAD